MTCRVRGTVRNPDDDGKVGKTMLLETSADRPAVQVGFLKAIAQECSASEQLELVQADLLTPNSYDTAILGCDYVLHTASPFFVDGTVRGLHYCTNTHLTRCKAQYPSHLLQTERRPSRALHPPGGGGHGERP